VATVPPLHIIGAAPNAASSKGPYAGGWLVSAQFVK
jgi:hypothetical protein